MNFILHAQDVNTVLHKSNNETGSFRQEFDTKHPIKLMVLNPDMNMRFNVSLDNALRLAVSMETESEKFTTSENKMFHQLCRKLLF